MAGKLSLSNRAKSWKTLVFFVFLAHSEWCLALLHCTKSGRELSGCLGLCLLLQCTKTGNMPVCFYPRFLGL
ncbi:hypothetical protein THICB3290082 [Thiomonas sp. CB3]|nr:hypothetical protein THICB3290082 [Thiomonas sp. CB3]